MVKITLIFLLMFSFACKADDMREYMKETDDLIEMKEYEEALERTIWFHNHVLEHRPSMYGVRLSFALSRWLKFGEKYPPALTSLKSIRNDKTNKIQSGSGTRELFHDVLSINRTLSEDIKTVELFKYLDKNQPKLAKKVWRIAKDTLIKEKEYTIIQNYIGNVLREYTVKEADYKESIERYSKEEYGARLIAHTESNFVEEAIELINLAIALNDKESAIEIRNRAKKIVKDYRLDNVAIK